MQSTANVSNDTNGASTRPPLKKQDSDKDFDDYFASLSLYRLVQSLMLTRLDRAILIITRR